MTADKNEHTPAAPARTGLSPVQLATSALASVSAAVVASFFGVAGTLIGAALASVITTVSAALYGASLRRTTERLRQLQRSRGRATGDVRAAGMTGVPAGARGSAPARAALPAHLDPRREPRRDPRRPPAPARPRLSRVALGAAGVFGLAMVLITSVELIGQRPVSAMVGASSERSTTTVGELTGGGATSTVPPTPAPASPGAQTTPPTTASATATPESTAPAPRSTAPAGTAATRARTTAPRSSDAGAGPSAPAAATTAP